MVSNIRNKIRQTWPEPFSGSLYIAPVVANWGLDINKAEGGLPCGHINWLINGGGVGLK